MKKVWILAKACFHELLREKFFLVTFGISMALMLMSLLLGELSFDEREKILVDVGFFGLQVSAVVFGLYAGATLLTKEFERQTCLLILSRPVSRSQFLVGKFFGAVAVMLVLGLMQLAAMALILSFKYSLFSLGIVTLSILMEALILFSFVYFLSLSVRPVIAFCMGFALMLFGHWIGDLQFLFKKFYGPESEVLIKKISYFVPQFYRFNWKTLSYVVNAPPMMDVVTMLVHGVAWAILFLVLADYQLKGKNIV